MVWIVFLILFFVIFGFLIFNAVALIFLSTGSFLHRLFGGGRSGRKRKNDGKEQPQQKKYRHGAEEAEYEIIE
ncbi:MAG: hypothetical protein FWB78_11320 [Treponema sp.]|nr:hypothetical protein [Treponema sp.]